MEEYEITTLATNGGAACLYDGPQFRYCDAGEGLCVSGVNPCSGTFVTDGSTDLHLTADCSTATQAGEECSVTPDTHYYGGSVTCAGNGQYEGVEATGTYRVIIMGGSWSIAAAVAMLQRW